MAFLQSMGIHNLYRKLKTHGLDEGRLGRLSEEVWRARVRDIMRQRAVHIKPVVKVKVPVGIRK